MTKELMAKIKEFEEKAGKTGLRSLKRLNP